MKKTSRVKITKFVLMLAAFVLVISTMSACTAERNVTNRYDLDVVNATSNFYVNDFAEIFTAEQEKSLMEKAVNFDEETGGIQVVITTVKSLNDAVVGYELVTENGEHVEGEPKETPKFTVEEVAYSMYKEYGIGKDDMGILILLSTGTGNGDGDIRIETGRQMQFYITDGLAGELLDDYAMEHLYNQQYAEGLVSLQVGMIDEIKKQVPSDWNSQVSSEEDVKADSETTEGATGIVAGEAGDNSGSDVAGKDTSKTKDSGKGILWGFFGSIAAAIAALVAFIRQKLKGNTERQRLEEAKKAEVSSLKEEYETKLAENATVHERKVRTLKYDYQKLEEEKNSQIEELEQSLEQANDEISTLTKKLEVMSDKYERAQRLHPECNFDEEVKEMIEGEYKSAAQKVDAQLTTVLLTVPSKENYNVFKSALELIDGTQSEVCKYVTIERKEIKRLYDESIALKEAFEKAEQEKRDRAAAQKAYNQIKSVYDSNPNGNHTTYEVLHSALAIFLGLSAAERMFFPDNTLIDKLKKAHSYAEEDFKDYNAARSTEENVRSIIGSMHSADEDDRNKLSRARSYYKELTSSQQRYFPDELISKLNRLINEAEDDHRRQERRRREEEERRRRAQQQRMNSSIHRSSGSSFGGHGGRPSGGGASRKF